MKRLFSVLLVISIISFILVAACANFEGYPLCDFFIENYLYFGAGSIHLGLFSAAMMVLWKKNLKTTLKSLRFPGSFLENLLFSISGFIAIFVVLFILGAIAIFTGFNDQEKVQEKVDELPIYILAFAIIAAPISEELFFRAFLVPRTGIVLSSFLFGMMHFAYGSVMEVAGAALIGLVLAGIFKISKSITPCLIIHVAYNLLSIAVMKLVV